MFRRQCFVVHTNKQLLTLLSMWALRKDMTLRVQFCLCVFFCSLLLLSLLLHLRVSLNSTGRREKNNNTTCQNAITFMRMVTLQRKSNENIQHFPYTHTRSLIQPTRIRIQTVTWYVLVSVREFCCARDPIVFLWHMQRGLNRKTNHIWCDARYKYQCVYARMWLRFT